MKKLWQYFLKLTVTISMVVISTTSFAQGELYNENVYTAVTPCRIIDTRLAGGAIAASETRSFRISGQTSYVSQGGLASDCGITAGVYTTGIAVNMVVVSPAAAGYITGFPTGEVKPQTASVNFSAGDVIGNSGIFKVAFGTTPTTPQLNIFSTSNTHLVVDIVGYFAIPKTKKVDCITTAFTSQTIAAGAFAQVFAPACPAPTLLYEVTGGSCNSNSIDAVLVGSDFTSCGYKNNGSTAMTGQARSRCCQITGRP